IQSFSSHLMQFLPVIYLLSLLLLPSLATDSCYLCASPELEENWEVTSFPNKPKGIEFTEDCSSNKDTDLKKTCPSSVCYEGIIPLNNKATYVRGCYSEFLNQETTYTKQNVTDSTCTYGALGKKTFIDPFPKNGVIPQPVQAYAASRWCVNLGEDEGCNIKLVYTAELFSNPGKYFATPCKNPGSLQEKQCIDCSHFGGAGDCSPGTQTFCRGAYCTKYEGYLNGDSMVIRTCAPSAPLDGDCAWIDSTTEFQLFGVTLQLPYKANHCFCIGENCNPASGVPSSLLISLLLPLLLSRFLPFFSSS
ncbi:hypothetical protein PENTCL1PPCAC_6910, partial [Pristionchus entomophagus]